MRRDFVYFCQKCLKIRNKVGMLVSFNPNSSQLRLAEAIMTQYLQRLPIRILILKARQMGMSTLVAAFLYWLAWNHAGYGSLVAANETDNTEALYDIQLRYIENHPSAFAPPIRQRSNRKEVLFQSSESGIRLSTAKKKRLGMSRTIRAFHGSEVAYWAYPQSALVSVLNAIPKLPQTFVALESTANGFNYWHKLWKLARAGQNDFKALFFAWHEHAEYSLPFASAKARDAFAATLGETERTMAKRHKLTLEQLHWRRNTIANECGASEELFRQEYPATEQEAFLLSGTCYFAADQLAVLETQCEPPKWQGIIEHADLRRGDLTPVYRADKAGPLRIWERPDPDHAYVIGADSAGGWAPIDPTERGGDFQDANVKDRNTGRQVADWHGRIDPTDYAHALDALGRWYNGALLAVEVNEAGHGLTVARELQRLQYPNQYYRDQEGKRSHTPTEYVGWLTTKTTRPLLLDSLKAAVHSGKSGYRDEELLSELRSFVREGNRYEAAGEAFDDRVIAAGITEEIWHSASPKAKPVITPQDVLKRFKATKRA